MNRIAKAVIGIVAIAVIASLVPVAILYVRREGPVVRNEEAVARIGGKTGELFGFVVMSDNHAGLISNDSATLKLIRHMNREERFRKLPIDFAAVTGDLTYRGSEWDYRTYNKIRSLIKWPVVSAAGNHDDDQGGAERFARYIGKKEFSFADRNSYFVVLDNTVGDLTDEQFAWLEEELERSFGYKHRFIFIHKAPISPYQESWYRPELNPWSHRFMKLCEKYKVDIVFSGHEHMFKKASYGGVKYITTGGGGMLTHIPDEDGGFLHYIVVRIHGDYVDYEVRRIFPPLWEFLCYYMWKNLFYLVADIIY